MSEKARLARQTVYATVAHGANLLPFVLWFIAAERLGPERFGLFSYALAFASVFEILADLGLRDYTVREVARDPGKLPLAARVLTWRLLLVGITTLVACSTFEITRPTPEARLVLWVMAPMVGFRALKNFLRGVLQSVGRFGVDTLITVADRVMMVSAGLAALFLDGTVLALAAALLLARLLDIGLSSWSVRRVTGLRPRGGWSLIWAAQREALPLGLFQLIVTAYTYADQIMIELLRGHAEVGLYSACFKLHEGFTLIPAVLAAPVLPALSASVEPRPARAAELARRATKYAVCAAIGLALVLGLAAVSLLELLYGDAYREAAPALVGLLSATIFTFSLWMLNLVLIATAQRAAMVRLVAFGLALNLALNAIMIPRIGYVGAAWATLFGEAVVFTLTLRTTNRVLPGIGLLRALARPAAAGAMALGGGALLRSAAGVAPLVAAPIAGVVFLVLLVVTRAFDRSDWEALRSLVRRPAAAREPAREQDA